MPLKLDPLCAATFVGSVPFDLYLPSASAQIPQRVCRECGIYHVSTAGMKRHSKEVHGNDNAHIEHDDEDIEQESDLEFDAEDDCMPVVTDMKQWMSSAWEPKRESTSPRKPAHKRKPEVVYVYVFLRRHGCVLCVSVFHGKL
jgi:hypothetical protein